MDYLIGLWKNVEQVPATGKIFILCIVFVCIFFLMTFWHDKLQPPGTGQESEWVVKP